MYRYLCAVMIAVLMAFPSTAVTLTVNAGKIAGQIPTLIYGSGMEDVNHEIYGGLYDQRIFGESFEEPGYPSIKGFAGFDSPWEVLPGNMVRSGGEHSKLVYRQTKLMEGCAEVELRCDNGGAIAGLIVNVLSAADGADNFTGYEISLDASAKELVVGHHDHDWNPLARVPYESDPSEWNSGSDAKPG